MFEGMNRRDVLKGALAAGAAAALGNTAEAKSSPETIQNPELERAMEIKRITNELNEKTQELHKAYDQGDEQKVEQIKRELNELFERAKPLIDSLSK